VSSKVIHGIVFYLITSGRSTFGPFEGLLMLVLSDLKRSLLPVQPDKLERLRTRK